MHANSSLLLTNVPINMSTCLRCANYSTSHANVPKACQVFQLHLLKARSIFQLSFKIIVQFLNFSNMLTICKFQEYLDNSRKLISRNKEFKFWHLQNFINSFMMDAGIIEISPLICRANQWTCFYMITASIMKELKKNLVKLKPLTLFSIEHVGFTEQLFG